jgi:hypothetical protein
MCRRYHAPDWDYKDDCPSQPRVFWSKEAEQRYHQRKEMELRHAIEARARREAAETRERDWAKASCAIHETIEEHRQATFDATREDYERGRKAYHEHLEMQDHERRLLRNQRVRERAVARAKGGGRTDDQ